jgi:membrane associated rhomboid family serine protease
MARIGSSPLSFPGFRGVTRQLVLVNMVAFFALLLFQVAARDAATSLATALVFIPSGFLHGYLWQPLTYSFIHLGIIGTAFELLSIWFLAGFLEDLHNSAWVLGLYASAVLGTAAAALAIYAMSGTSASCPARFHSTAASAASSAC